MQRADVYFTWPDRRFRYECAGCGACCKGHGIGIDVAAGQLVQLLGKRPELAAFVRRRGDAVTAFNPRDRCWFYDDDDLCRIEREDGRAAKPASCRLFPFNRVFRIGATTVIDFNSVICPLAVGDDGVAHDDVLAELATIRDPAIVGTVLPGQDSLIATERAIAEAMFADADLNAAWHAQHEGALDVGPGFEALLGVAWRPPTDPLPAVQLTPSMRFNELWGPRQYAPRERMTEVLARMWLAWLGFAALGERLARRALGLQELTTIWSEQAPVMHVIARWHDVPVLRPGPIELPPDLLAQRLAQRFVDNKRPRRTLGELVVGVLGPAEPAARVVAIKQADALVRAALV